MGHFNSKRFSLNESEKIKRLLKHKVGTIISEQETNQEETSNKEIIEITNGSQVPQTLVDSTSEIKCEYWSNKGTHDEKGQYIELCVESTCYRIRADFKSFNKHGMGTSGRLQTERNKIFFDESLPFYFDFGGLSPKDVVEASDDKWIGFQSYDTQLSFACVNNKENTFKCYEFKPIKKNITRTESVEKLNNNNNNNLKKMRIKKNGQIITLTESDLNRIVKKALREQRLNEGITVGPQDWSQVRNIGVKPGDNFKLNSDGNLEMNGGGSFKTFGNYTVVKNPTGTVPFKGGALPVKSFDPNTNQVTFTNGVVVGPKE